MGLNLNPIKIKGSFGGMGGDFFEPIWGLNTSYYYGGGYYGSGAAPIFDKQDEIGYANIIKKGSGLDKLTFDLQIRDKILYKENSLEATADIWSGLVKGYGYNPINFNDISEDLYFRNKLISFAKADELQQKLSYNTNDAFQKASESTSTIHDVGTSTLSGGAFSAAKAFAHYIWGDGQNLNVNINNLGLNIKASDIPLLSQTVRHNTEVGQVHISTNVGYNTSNDSLKTGAYLGNITLKVEGDFNKQANGTWTFNGVARAYQDEYDFNEASRGFVGETLTSLGRVAKGTTYNIDITGENKISLVGFGTHVD
ncbi:lipid II-degrading bacteriocin [Pseudomonas protegens]|uniref:lipid II-degrading bacteriocin n=1 Tax=Pseudomonas protegens TaxID=380021 RepID=UPI0037F292BD